VPESDRVSRSCGRPKMSWRPIRCRRRAAAVANSRAGTVSPVIAICSPKSLASGRIGLYGGGDLTILNGRVAASEPMLAYVAN